MIPTIEANRTFVPKIDPKTGKKISVPVTTRKLFLDDKPDGVFPHHYRIVLVTRHGETRYSVTFKPVPVQTYWEKDRGVPLPAWDGKYARENDKGSYDREGVLGFLKHRVADPEAVLTSLESARPEAA